MTLAGRGILAILFLDSLAVYVGDVLVTSGSFFLFRRPLGQATTHHRYPSTDRHDI